MRAAARDARALAAKRQAKADAIRARPAVALQASRRAESRYVLDLLVVMANVHGDTVRLAKKNAPHAQLRQDAANPLFGMGGPYRAHLFKYIEQAVPRAFDHMAGQVDKGNVRAVKLIGITPRAAGVTEVIARARDENVRLIRGATDDFLDQVHDVLAGAYGKRVEDLAKELEERVGVSNSRAKLIARDQTLKLNAAVTKHRMGAAGISSYTWSTSNDERVRPGHAALEGQQFRFDDPPPTNDDGDRNNPGEDFQCRCVPLPVLEDDEASGDDEEPDEVAPGDDEAEGEASPAAAEEPDDEEPAATLDIDEHFLGVHVEPAATMTAEDVVGGVNDPGIAKFMRGLKPSLELHGSNIGIKNAEGQWDRGKIKLATTVPAPRPWSGAWGTNWRIADTRADAQAKVRSSFIHELGHHVHLGSLVANRRFDVDDRVTQGYAALGLKPKARADILDGAAKSPAISRYAVKNKGEYFAESFNAYLEEPDALKAHDPGGWDMVRDVLKMVGAE